MKQFILFIFFIGLLCAPIVKAETPQWLLDAGCYAVYRVPEGAPYNERVERPPFWTANRWECLKEAVTYTPFENSPANGTDTEFFLALGYVIEIPNTTYYPILYIDESLLHIYTFGVGQTERFDYTVNQGTGKITLSTAPTQGDQVYFEIANQ